MKRCSKCKIKKKKEEFGFVKKSTDGLNWWCKECNRAQSREDYHKNKKARINKNREWALINKEYRKNYHKERLKDPAKRKRRNELARIRLRDPEKREKKRIMDKEYYQKTRAHQLKMAKQRYKDNPDYFKQNARRRKNRIKSSIREPYTKQEIYNRDKGLCFRCGELVDLTLKHPDPMCFSFQHLIPLIISKDDRPDNVATSHLVCNLRQGRQPSLRQQHL